MRTKHSTPQHLSPLCTEKNYYRIKIKSRHGISPVENKHKIFVADIIRIKGENEHELKM
jgi:hypothetical protein